MKKLIGFFMLSVLVIATAFTARNSPDGGYKIGDVATNLVY